MASGESAAARAAAKRAIATKYRQRAERAERAAADWARGAKGEVALSQVLAPLAADGYHRLDDRRIPGSEANLDHVLVGPAGAFVLDAKNWSGHLSIDGKTLRQDNRRRDSHLEHVRVQAVGVATIIEEIMGPRRVEVRPIICFTGEATLRRHVAVDRVHLFDSTELVPFLRGLEPRLDQAAVDEVMRGLLERLPPRIAPDVDATNRAPAPDPPAELVLFLQPWAKHGHRRLYVKSADGAEVGHLNLVTGEVQSADGWHAVLAQLLPHHAVAGAPGFQVEPLSAGATGVLRRFLDAMRRRPNQPPLPPIFTAYHWRNYGKERLYVNRIDGDGSKIEAGWFDLVNGIAQPAQARFGPVLHYCGATYRAKASR